MIRLEIDLSIEIDNFKILIFCDGEAFHGCKTIFGKNSIQTDERKSRAINTMYPFVVRYSETQIKTGQALHLFEELVRNIRNGKISNYYYSWMTKGDLAWVY